MPSTQQAGSRRTYRKNTGRNAAKAIIVLSITLLLLAGIGVSTYVYYTLDDDTFYKGIFVDGVALEGMTLTEAVDAIYAKHQSVLDSMKIQITYEDRTWEYDHDSIQAEINVEDVVEKAYKVGRTGSLLERIREINDAAGNGISFETTLTYDTTALKKDIKAIADELYIEPQDATITFHNKAEEMFTFTPEVIGRQISVDEVLAAIKEKTDNRDFTPYELKAETLHPKYTLEEVKTWTSKIAVFETIMTGAPERIHNITLSSSSFDGIRINPGEEFSLNKATGPRGLKEGYKNAPVIVKGVTLADEPGGGNCQTSTTLYGALVRADLEIIERWHHSWPSTYTDVGEDAMVDYPNCDLKFKNNKDSAIFISRKIDGDKIIVEIYGKKSDDYDYIDIVTETLSISSTPAMTVVQDPNLYEGDSVVEYKSRPNIKTQSYRVYYKDGKEIKRVKEAYSNYPKITGKKRVGTKPRPVVEQPSETPGDNSGTGGAGNNGTGDAGNAEVGG